jgi:hypothetical protein
MVKSGKSMLVKLLLFFYEIQSERISLDAFKDLCSRLPRAGERLRSPLLKTSE